MKRIAICVGLVFIATSLMSMSGNGNPSSPREPTGENPYTVSCTRVQYATVASATVETWYIEMVDSVGKTGQHTDIAYGPDGTIFISYHDFLQEDLRCAYKYDGEWEVDTVDAEGDVGAYASIDVSSNGRPGISYYDETNLNLKYAIREDGAWTVEIVDGTGDVGRYASLAIDGQDNPHLVYYDATNQDLKYATRSGGSWDTETVASDGGAGRYASLAIDGQGAPHCTYGLDETTLLYAHRNADGWETTQVDGDIKLFESTAIAMEDGIPHISYFDVSDDPNWRLRYATLTDGVWSIEVVDPDIYGFWNERGLAMGVRDGIVHIGYFHWDDWDAGYAYKYGDRWMTEIVESQGDVGAFASLTLDSQGYPHMSYMDRSNMGLKYARKRAYAPAAPDKPEGPDRGRTGSEYTYIASTADLDGDELQYGWDWDGDQTVDEWTELAPSGEDIETAHTWDGDGTYVVRVKARDSRGLESDWSEPLQVSMPYRRASLTATIWQWLMEHMPFFSSQISFLS